MAFTINYSIINDYDYPSNYIYSSNTCNYRNGGNNQLSGQIPEEIGRLPLRTMCVYIYIATYRIHIINILFRHCRLLSNNQLSGTLPPSFENCTLMRDFNVAFNLITGPIFDFTQFTQAVAL